MEGNGDTAGEETSYAAAVRGGVWGSGSLAGVFALGLNYAPSDWLGSVGFRCCR